MQVIRTLSPILAWLLAVAVQPARASVLGCPSDSLVVHIAQANSFQIVFDGRGVGQVFEARDTLIASVSVWIDSPYDSTCYKMQLFMTSADSTGVPNQRDIIFLGPVAEGCFGRESTEVNFDLNPPRSLPRPGKYFFVVNEESCLGDFNVLSDTTNSYPGGEVWRTGTTFCDGRGPGGLVGPSFATSDLIFKIKFCDTMTPVRRSSWGRLKMRYR